MGAPDFITSRATPFFPLQKFNSQKKTSHEQAIVLGDGSRVDNLFEGHKMLSDSSIKLITIQRAHSQHLKHMTLIPRIARNGELINSKIIFNLILAEY